jgi:hypothetical protein
MKVIIKWDKKDPTVKTIVYRDRGKKNEMLHDLIKDLDTHPLCEWYNVVEDSYVLGDGDGNSKKYESKYEKENHPLPSEIAKDIVKVASSLKGCTIKFVDECNKYLNFNLHEKLHYKYGFTGAKRLYNIFKFN